MRADAQSSSTQALALLVHALAWTSVGALIIVSVIPGEMRPHVMADKHYEHFAAYLLCAGWFGLRYRSFHQVVATGLMLATLSGFLEVIQAWVPGRTASLADWASSTSGAWCGLALAAIVRYLLAAATCWNRQKRCPDRLDQGQAPRREGRPAE